MIQFLYIVFLIAVLWVIVRNLWNRYHRRVYKYKLFELRDRLRRLVIDGDLEKDNWLFYYFDHSLSKNISTSYFITLFSMTALIIRFTKNKEYDQFSDKLNADLEKYPAVKQIKKEYTKATADYIFNQHRISIGIVFYPLIYFIIGIKTMKYKFGFWIDKSIIHGENDDDLAPLQC